MRNAETITAKLTTDGSLDGSGAGDHDEPYRFGRRPRTDAPFPFTFRQYARLLVVRSRHQACATSWS